MKLTAMIVDAIEHPDWVVRGWKVKFILSDKLLNQAKLLSRADNWFDDPIVADTWMAKMAVCFYSIQQFYNAFGFLPHVGDRLFDEDTGMLVLHRSIDGGLSQITFTVCL